MGSRHAPRGRKAVLPVHPFLLAAFPVLFLYAHNVQYDVSAAQVGTPLLVSVAAAGAVFGLAWLALGRNPLKAALATSILLALFFTYGHAFGLAGGRWPALADHRILLPAWIALAGLGILGVARAGPAVVPVTRGLNALAAILVLSNLVTAGWSEVSTRETAPRVAGDVLAGGALPDGAPTAGRTRPDIYYVIFDRYASGPVLKDLFGHDNTPFLDFLRSKGFYVAEDSTTNYPRTSHSLASSLNLDYLHALLEDVRRASDDFGPVYDLIQNDLVPRYLKDRGYTYVHIGSWWTPTASNPQADLNVKMRGSLSEFAATLAGTTALDALGGEFDFDRREYVRVLFEFDQLARTRAIPGPKFVFAHILLPHEPFVFDRNGDFVPEEERDRRPRSRNYVEQLMFANTKIAELVETLLAGPEDRRPVIILQSDEGAFEALETGAESSGQDLKRKFGILNSYYLPGVEDPPLYPSITPVNSFRLVFDLYFGADLPLLPDRNYVYRGPDDLYTFVEVTDRLEAIRLASGPP